MREGETGLEAKGSAFFFGGMLGEEPDADLGEELGVDLDGELEVDEDESSACAPYLARQMSFLGSRTPGVKDTPFFGSVWGAKPFHGLFSPFHGLLSPFHGLFPSEFWPHSGPSFFCRWLLPASI